MKQDMTLIPKNLQDHPKILHLASLTKLDEFSVVGRICRLYDWYLFQESFPSDGSTWKSRSESGQMIFHMPYSSLDRKVQHDGFINAMKLSGWVDVDAEGFSFTEFASWNTTADNKLRQLGDKCKVYFIVCIEQNTVKIGSSKNPKARMAQLQTSHASPLSLAFTTPGGQEEERRLHDKYKAHRLKGEWFRLEGELLQFVQSKIG